MKNNVGSAIYISTSHAANPLCAKLKQKEYCVCPKNTLTLLSLSNIANMLGNENIKETNQIYVKSLLFRN